MNDETKARSPETEKTPQLAEPTWGRAVGLAFGWTVGGAVVVAIIAGLLNGLDLVDGQDVVVVLWVAVPVTIAVPVVSGFVHRSWRVALVVPIFAAVSGALAFVVFLVVVFSSFRAV